MANEIVPVNEMQGEVIFYQPDSTMRLEVRLEDETVWLTQQQMVDLFQSSKANVSEHIRNIYDQGELEQKATVRIQLGRDYICGLSCQYQKGYHVSSVG